MTADLDARRTRIARLRELPEYQAGYTAGRYHSSDFGRYDHPSGDRRDSWMLGYRDGRRSLEESLSVEFVCATNLLHEVPRGDESCPVCGSPLRQAGVV